ncbi:MAG: hypothetical protein AAB652_00280 [Patescibacteria group bacterium]
MAPFMALVVIAAFAEPTVGMALFFAIAFFVIAGIKDLWFINRAAAYKVLIFLLFFLSSLLFFRAHREWHGLQVFASALSLGVLFFVLVKSFLSYGGGDGGRRRVVLTLGVMSLMLWQLVIVLLFLPLSFLSQTALLFLTSAVFVEYAEAYFGDRLSREKILSQTVIFAILALLIFLTGEWRL